MSRNPPREGKFSGLPDSLLGGVLSSEEDNSISDLSGSLREDSTGETLEEEEDTNYTYNF